MGNIQVFSRSTTTGNPYLWRPTGGNNFTKDVPIAELGIERICNKENDFITTYVNKRIWVATIGAWSAPPYVECDYVQ